MPLTGVPSPDRPKDTHGLRPSDVVVEVCELDIEFPFEFIVAGTPLSLSATRKDSIAAWKTRIKEASRAVLPEGFWAWKGRIAVTIFYFPAEVMVGDVDNIVKFIIDAMKQHIYVDDKQAERVVVQKFEPGNVFSFKSPTKTLVAALNGKKPLGARDRRDHG